MLGLQHTKLLRMAITIAIAASMLVGSAGASRANPDDAPSTALPNGFGAIVTDPATRRVFVSSRWSDVVTVLDETGDVQASLEVARPSDLIVRGDRLYALASEAGTIHVFDTTSLVHVDTLGSGLTTPFRTTLAWAGGKLWTSTGCSSNLTCLASVDPGNGATTTFDALPGLTNAPQLVASPADPNALIAWAGESSSPPLTRLDVASGGPVVEAVRNVGGIAQVAFTADGSRVVVATTGHLVELTSDTLEPTARTYETGNSPVGVAIDPISGQVAATKSGQIDAHAAYVFAAEGSTPSWTYAFGPNADTVVPRGLAWQAGGTTLYVMSHDADGNLKLNRVTRPGPIEPTQTALSGSATAEFGQPVSLTATVSSTTTGRQPTWGTVTFREGAVVLGSGAITDGQATLTTNHRFGPGPHQITASYPGNRTLGPSTAAPITVTIGRSPTTTQLTASPQTTMPMDNVELEAMVTGDWIGAVPTGTVTFYDSGKPIGSAQLSFAGQGKARARLQFWIIVPGTYTYTASYAGDHVFQPSASPTALQHVLVATQVP